MGSRSPSTTQLRALLGRSFASWAELTAYVHDHYRVIQDWSQEDDGWTLRLRKSGKSLLTLSTKDRRFDVVFVVPPARVDEALALDLRDETRALIRAARPYPDGRWIRIPVRALRDVADIKTLIAFKGGPTRATRHPPERRDRWNPNGGPRQSAPT